MDLKALLAAVVWNTSFENNPEAGDDPSYGDDEMRLDRRAVRERFEKEHKMDLSIGTVGLDGWHKPGTAVVYYQTAEPTTRPDGVTALDSSDNGRLWIRSSDYRLSFYVHPNWVRATTVNNLDNTFSAKNTFNGNLRIPTSEPAELVDGDVWLV
jgi:hypothetical protein